MIHTEAGLVAGVFVVRVIGKELVKNNAVRPGTADWKSIADDRPLGFAIEAKDFTEVVD